MPFPCCRHQISFVSGQLLPTVLAAGLPGAEPACVHGIVTPEMKAHGRILREALESRGRRYREHELRDSGQQGYYPTTLSAINSTDYSLVGWYDNQGASAGGRIRILVATKK